MSSQWLASVIPAAWLVLLQHFALQLFLGGALAQPASSQDLSGDATPDQAYAIAGSILKDPGLIDDAERGLHHLYNMEYGQADSIFLAIDSRYPEHPAGPFLRSLVSWWQILTRLESGDDADDEAFYAAMGHVISRSEKMLDQNDEDFDAMFFKGAAHGFRGRLRSNREEWLKAGKDGKEALEYIFKIAEADTTNADFQFGSGVYNYFAAAIPEKYPMVKPILFFFPSADREKGLRQLKQTATRGRLIQTEAVYFLLQIYLIYEPDFQHAVRYAAWLTGKYPDNPFFKLMEGRVYVKWGRWSRAMVSFDQVTAGHIAEMPGHTDAMASVAVYYRGRYHMQNSEYEDAEAAFRSVEFLTTGQEKDSRFRIESALRLGMVYDSEGRRELAKAEYRRVLNMRDSSESHDRAKKYLKTPYTRS